MLLTKEIEIRIAGNVGQYYKKNNIDVKFNQINKLPIEVVNPESHLIIDAKCDICGKEVKVQYRRYNQSISRGGYYTCSSKCGSQKRKDTCIEKYGCENFVKTDNFKEKSKISMLKKWGTSHFRQSKEWKIKNENIEKEKRKNTVFNDFLGKNSNVIGQDSDNFIVRCDIHGDIEIPKAIFSNRKIIKTELCVKCNPVEKNISGKEILLFKLIREIYDGEIIQSYKIDMKEIDIYLPMLKIGFEFNGLRWHSELFKEDDYHIKKTTLCKKNNIRLIHIFEDDFDNKIDIIKSIIKNLIGDSIKIYARKTQLKVVEDNKINQIVTKKILETNNFKSTILDDGYAAINLLENEYFDIILMDINMPIINGYETTRLIRKKGITTPIIALTAFDKEEITEQALSAGMNDIIIKPFEQAKLFQIINNLINKKETD